MTKIHGTPGLFSSRFSLFISAVFLLTCCSDEVDYALTGTQADLLGKAVDFNATKTEEFQLQSRTTWRENGSFNEDDLMRIYRQYATGDNSWDVANEAYRTYNYHTRYASGTTMVSLGTDWRVVEGRTGMGRTTDGIYSKETFTQEESDSITWENGKTVRFRSWTRSNYAGALENCYKEENGLTNYYPDFCISDWVTVSGPTEQVPLTMRHICSRITIDYRNNGTQFYKVELATSLDDYKRKDNADSSDHDNGISEAGKTDEQAQEEFNKVMDAYNRMCMPAGVDITKSELYAMTTDFWNPLKNNSDDNRKLRFLEDVAPNTFCHFGDHDAEWIRTNVVRPTFANLNSRCYLITIPYDMSNGATQGNIITLPACTRFRVYLRDVNNGDGNRTPGYEGTYHIFTLSDVKDANGNQAFPDGLELNPGYSYKFRVGYRYDQLTITANDNFSWAAQDAEEDALADAGVTMPETSPSQYSWWKETIKNAIPKDGGDFNPEFHITNQQEFIEFINLINNTAATKTTGLYRARRNKENPDHATNSYDKYYWWYTKVSDNKQDTTWVTSDQATAMGYILYESYHAANGNQPAYSQEEYIRGNYPFYDETRDRHYTVMLDNDIDLYDWEMPSIGNSATTPFMGYFDGQMHRLVNVNMKDEYLFKYIRSAAIRNLRLESTHRLSLVKEGTKTCYIIGVSLLAHSTTNSIAASLTSNDQNNPSYVVGCIHVGDACGALVGESDNLYMYGCMQAAYGIAQDHGALLGNYLPYNGWKFFSPQISFDYNDTDAELKGKPSWGRFMCNYYDTELSPGTNAVANIRDLYSPLEYIRGRESFVLKAKNDNLLTGVDVTFNSLTSVELRLAYYGLAPWKAMNYAIMQYNRMGIGSTHTCKAHYVNNSTGYVHRYPELTTGEPTSENSANPLEQKN